MAAAIPAVVMAAGTMYMAKRQSDAQLQATNAESGQLEFNARLAELQSQDAIARGEEAAAQARKRGQLIIGKQRAGFAGQGVDVSRGTPLQIQEDTAAISEMDAIQIKNNAWREAWGHKVEALGFSSNAAFNRLAGQNQSQMTLIGGGLNSISTGLSTYSNAKDLFPGSTKMGTKSSGVTIGQNIAKPGATDLRSYKGFA